MLSYGITDEPIPESDKIKDKDQALWYVRQTLENGWSREQLNLQIHNRLYQRQVGKAKSDNFDTTLPAPPRPAP